MRVDMKHVTSLNKFCIQLNEFCLLFQEQILLFEKTCAKPPSAQLALAFAESLMLCPTEKAARVCIGRDLAGARSFLVAADAILRRIRSQRFEFTVEEPKFQTRFYLLACGIIEILRTRREQVLSEIEPTYSNVL